MKILIWIILGIAAAFILWNIISLIIKLLQKPLPEKPEETINMSDTITQDDSEAFTDLYYILSDKKPIYKKRNADSVFINSVIKSQTDFINKRYDCSDFRMILLFRIYKDCFEKLPDESRKMIERTFLDFKYFMDEPGNDSMCFWSENHQILFATAEYLAGQQWPDRIFTNNGMTGKEHMAKALERINIWMEQRFKYGFSEYLSNCYLMEDVGPMANYIEYSNDMESVSRMKIIMDLLWFDVALTTVNNRFCTVSSRMYTSNKTTNFFGNGMTVAMNRLWGKENLELMKKENFSFEEISQMTMKLKQRPNEICVNFCAMYEKGYYKLPQVIKEIALNQENSVIKMSSGLSPEDIESEDLLNSEPAGIMAQWGAESFTNPETILNTVKYIKENKMERNNMIYYFKFLELPLFRFINLKKFCERNELMPHGIATRRGNIYTFKTKYYALSTVCNCSPGSCGAQEHIWNANLANHLSLFTTQPSRDDGIYDSSPGYWEGNGRRPMSVQNKNINISIYKLPEKKRPMEFNIAKMTHAYMPKEFYNRFEQINNYIFAQKDNTLIAMITDAPMKYKSYDKKSAEACFDTWDTGEKYKIKEEFDLCRYGGNYHIYITELSDTDNENFENFKDRIRKNKVIFKDSKVTYCSRGDSMEVSFEGNYKLNGKNTDLEFKRYDCKYCQAELKPKIISIHGNNHNLTLDFNRGLRTEN